MTDQQARQVLSDMASYIEELPDDPNETEESLSGKALAFILKQVKEYDDTSRG